MHSNFNKLEVFTIANKKGMELQIINYGATIISLKVPDRYANLVDVIVGLPEATDYVQDPYSNALLFLGSSIGRYAGRISKGKFEIDGLSYFLRHDEGVHLHGGYGFDKKYWSGTILNGEKSQSIIFTYTSPHLEEGYPGKLEVEAIFELTDSNRLNITYMAKTDIDTPVNLTSHPYLNLNGKNSILDHELMINSKHYLEVDHQLLPTGKILESKNTRWSRNKKAKIKSNNFNGFDDTFVLEKESLKVTLYSEESGINLNIYTNQPAVVVHAPKCFPNLVFKENIKDVDFPAICFEPQNFPDAPNNAHFPNSILKPNEKYINQIVYEFSVM